MKTFNPGAETRARATEASLGEVVVGWDVWPRDEHVRSLIVTAILAAVAIGGWWVGRSSDNDGLMIVALVIAAMAAFGTIVRVLVFLYAMVRSGREVTLFERGLIEGRSDRPSQVVGFAGTDLADTRVRIIRNGVDHGVRITLQVVGPSGPLWTLGGPSDFMSAAADPIANQHATVKVNELLTQLQRGENVNCGALVLTPTGLIAPDGQTIPYQRLRGYRVDEGIWKFEHGDVIQTEATGVVNETPNHRAMVALVRALAPQMTV